jgi:hypothetical protein
MSNQSIIEHKANMYYVEFREDYLMLCMGCAYKKPTKEGQKSKASPYCKSLILAILEGWTNDKRGRGEDLSIFMSYPQWVKSMYGMFGRCTIIDSVDELIGEGLLSREPYRLYGRDTFKYCLKYQEINRRLKSLPERHPNEKEPQVEIIGDDPSTSKPHQSINRPDPSTFRRVASTSKPVTDLLIDGYPSKSRRNIESTKHLSIETAKEDTDVASTFSQSDSDDAAHPSPPLSLEEKLPFTEENATDPVQDAPPFSANASTEKEAAPNEMPSQQTASNQLSTKQANHVDNPVAGGGKSPDPVGASKEASYSQPALLVPEKPAKDTDNKKPEKPIQIKPAMPAPTALWPSAETAVQIVEAKKGRRYSDTTRTQELTEAKKVLKMEYDDGLLTRRHFEDAWDEMVSWAFWKEKGVKPLIRFLRKDDKIITILDDLGKKSGRRAPPSACDNADEITSKRELTADQQEKLRDASALLARMSAAKGTPDHGRIAAAK